MLCCVAINTLGFRLFRLFTTFLTFLGFSVDSFAGWSSSFLYLLRWSWNSFCVEFFLVFFSWANSVPVYFWYVPFQFYCSNGFLILLSIFLLGPLGAAFLAVPTRTTFSFLFFPPAYFGFSFFVFSFQDRICVSLERFQFLKYLKSASHPITVWGVRRWASSFASGFHVGPKN